MTFFAFWANFSNAKYKSKRKSRGKFKSFMHRLLVNMGKATSKSQSFFKQWMVKMRGKLIRLRLRGFWLHMGRGIWCLMMILKPSAAD
jgi:hypothetical protein